MSVFAQLYKSLYSPKDMARFRFQKIGKTILYILLLSLLTTIPESIQTGKLMKEQFSLLSQTVETDIPDFQIKDGKLLSDIKEPIIKEEVDFTFVFDPNTTEIPASLKNEDGIFLLQDKAIAVASGRADTYSYASFSEFTISKQDIRDFLDFMQSIYPVALFVIGLFLFLFNSFISFLGITLLAFGGTFISGQMNRKLNYRQLWTLTAYSFTIPTFFFTVMKFLHTAVPFPVLIFTGVTFFLLYLIIKEIPPAKQKIA
ncbi:MAG: DUF1189 domain-containing protein [Ectobacillus sp.]